MLTPALNKNVEQWDDIAGASSLCGACYEACPVKIPLHDMLIYLRRRKVERGYGDKAEGLGMKGFGAIMAKSQRFNSVMKVGRIGQKLLVRDGGIPSKLGPLKSWNNYRIAPKLADESFRESWKGLQAELDKNSREMDPAIQKRMEDLLAKRKREELEGGAGHD